MRKEELRLAVVIYGGASLAVYMHGVTKELFKLVQASKRVRDTLEEGTPSTTAVTDTEDIYEQLLLKMNQSREFRVVIDVIAGASAGAINGSMLAKALVNDLPLDAQTDVWLEKADVDHLTDDTVNSWRRVYTFPFLKAVTRLFPPRFRSNSETRIKLERFLRKAWLAPPLSGKRLCNMLLDALQQVNKAHKGTSLLPHGQRLDFYASITDLFGYPRSFRLNESTVIREAEHAVVARLLHIETPQGRKTSDFRASNDPALVWAARASSSYAGAFAPFHHSELASVLEERGESWDAETFLQRKVLLQDGKPASEAFDPADRHFVDGGIVNNKPFSAAIEALHHRPADRAVDRCIVYIEPIPNPGDKQDPKQFLKFFGTIRAAISTIPRNQPILSELNEVAERDANARINQRLIDSNRDRIDQLVGDARKIIDRAANLGAPTRTTDSPQAEHLRALRIAMRTTAQTQMGVAFEAYNQRRVWRLSEGLISEWQMLLPGLESQDTELAMVETVEHWLAEEIDPSNEYPHAVFLNRFDVTYRVRRLQFVIRSINQHFSELDEASPDGEVIGALKLQSYAMLEKLYGMRRAENLNSSVLNQIRAASTTLPLPPRTAVTMLRLLSRALRLPVFDQETDALFANSCAKLSDTTLRDSVLTDYAGFALYDVLLTSGGSDMQDTDPLTRLRIERISPEDSMGLRDQFQGLRSRDLMSFAGFFNRSFREHDYLWGRLNGADRCVDLLSKAAGALLDDTGKAKLRRELFTAILDSEEPKLTEAKPLLARLRLELAKELPTRI